MNNITKFAAVCLLALSAGAQTVIYLPHPNAKNTPADTLSTISKPNAKAAAFALDQRYYPAVDTVRLNAKTAAAAPPPPPAVPEKPKPPVEVVSTISSPAPVSSPVLSPLDDQDILLGLNGHSAIVRQLPVMPPSEMVSTVETVYRNMARTPTYSAGTAIPPSLFVLNSPQINAFATAGGRLYVNRGLVESVRGNPGILAFVIGHEMVHNRNHHGLDRYLRAIQAQQTIRQAYAQNVWVGLAAVAANKVAEAKFQRDEEHEADRLGLLIAAEAGYHPDYAVLATRHLRLETGESSKFAAFFQGHPRWTTREQRAEGIRDKALAIFNAKWPDAASSPGGKPPALIVVDEWKTQKGKENITVSFSTETRNVEDQPILVTALLVREKPGAGNKALQEKTFPASTEEKWSLTLDKKANDKFGKRYVKVTAKMGDQLLWETESKKID